MIVCLCAAVRHFIYMILSHRDYLTVYDLSLDMLINKIIILNSYFTLSGVVSLYYTDISL